MSKKSYLEKLKDPRWQKKRLEILERDEWKCQVCDATKSTLHVHHTCYIKGNEPWDYEDNQLITLCEECHDIEHGAAFDDIKYYIKQLKENGILLTDIVNLFCEAMPYTKSRDSFNRFSTCAFDRDFDAYLKENKTDEVDK